MKLFCVINQKKVISFLKFPLISYAQVVHPYSSIDTTAGWKKLRFILSVRSDFHMIDSLSIAIHAFVSRVSISLVGEEARRQLHKNVASNIEQVLAATPHKAPTIRPPASHQENYPSWTKQTCRTLLEKQGRAHKRCTPMDPYIWPSKSRTTSSNIHTAAM